MTLIELKTTIGTAWIKPELVSMVEFFDTGPCYVRCGYESFQTFAQEGEALLKTIVESRTAAAPVKTEVRAVVSIECRETYSNSTQQNFKFFTCVMENGQKVNIFDHPDSSRNTFKICENAGWHYLLNLEVGDLRNFDPAIPITVTHDGEWYSLVNIMHHDLYVDMTYNMTVGEPRDANQDDIPWDSDTSAAVDNLKSGLDLDDDAEGDDDNQVFYVDGDELPASPKAVEPVDKSFVAHDDAVSDGCVMCGNEWLSLNQHGRCSDCQQIWDS